MTTIKIPQSSPRQLGSAIDVKTVGLFLGYYAYAEQRLMEAQASWLVTIPQYELKIELGYQLYDDAGHVDAFRKRLPELGVFKGGVEPANDDLARFFDELTNTDDTIERLVGVYWVLRPLLAATYQRHLDQSDTVADQPTVRMLRAAQRDHEHLAMWGDALLWKLIGTPDDLARAKAWRDHLETLLKNAGGLTGRRVQAFTPVEYRHAGPGRRFITASPVRDARFRVATYNRREGRAATDVWNEETFLKYMFMMVEGEIEVTEACGRALFDFPDAPWEFRYQIARQLWDEARHAELSLQRFFELGGTLDLLPVRDNFPLYFGPAQHRDLGRRLAHLNQVVEGWVTDDFAMMVDICRVLDDERSARLFEQLIADEWLHIKIGADWIPRFTADDPAYRAEIVAYRLEAERELYAGLADAAEDAKQIRAEQTKK